MKSCSQLFLQPFMLILAAWIIVGQPTESKETTNCTIIGTIIMCFNNTELANLNVSHTCKNKTEVNCYNCCLNDVKQKRSCVSNLTRCFHVDIGSECAKRLQNISVCNGSLETTVTETTTTTKAVTRQSTSVTTTTTMHTKSTKCFDSSKSVCSLTVSVGLGVLLFIIVFIVALALVFRRRRSKRRQNHTSKVAPIALTTTAEESVVESVSPIYCEADIFHYSSSEPHSETAETVDTEVNDDESEVEDKYCNPEFVEDEYETMNPVMPPRDSGEYSYPYEHINMRPAYVNTLPRWKQKKGSVKDNYYEYPQTWRRSSYDEYRYAYDWWSIGSSAAVLSSSEPMLECSPLDKGDDSFYENHQALSRESLEDENETVTLEYVTIL